MSKTDVAEVESPWVPNGVIIARFTVDCAAQALDTPECSVTCTAEVETLAEAKREFIEAGWGYTSKHGWLCPDHTLVARSWGVDTSRYPIRNGKKPDEAGA